MTAVTAVLKLRFSIEQKKAHGHIREGGPQLKNPIRKALRKTVHIRGKTAYVEPSDRLGYGMPFTIVALLSLTALEAVHIVYIRSFSSEIFVALSMVVGTILGAFFRQKA